jgi:hypothetical protein
MSRRDVTEKLSFFATTHENLTFLSLTDFESPECYFFGRHVAEKLFRWPQENGELWKNCFKKKRKS